MGHGGGVCLFGFRREVLGWAGFQTEEELGGKGQDLVVLLRVEECSIGGGLERAETAVEGG